MQRSIFPAVIVAVCHEHRRLGAALSLAPSAEDATGRAADPGGGARAATVRTRRRFHRIPVRQWRGSAALAQRRAGPPAATMPIPSRPAIRGSSSRRRATRSIRAFCARKSRISGHEAPGTIVIDTPNKFLYLVEDGGKAMRYGVGVGRPGFTWAGVHTVSAKKEWPDWTPPEEMLERQPGLPHFMAGGPDNPLGARAMYLGSTLYRIHGSNEPWTIGHNVSSGCIRLRNADVIDLYSRVKVGTKVVVL